MWSGSAASDDYCSHCCKKFGGPTDRFSKLKQDASHCKDPVPISKAIEEVFYTPFNANGKEMKMESYFDEKDQIFLCWKCSEVFSTMYSSLQKFQKMGSPNSIVMSLLGRIINGPVSEMEYACVTVKDEGDQQMDPYEDSYGQHTLSHGFMDGDIHGRLGQQLNAQEDENAVSQDSKNGFKLKRKRACELCRSKKIKCVHPTSDGKKFVRPVQNVAQGPKKISRSLMISKPYSCKRKRACASCRKRKVKCNHLCLPDDMDLSGPEQYFLADQSFVHGKVTLPFMT